MATVAGVAGLGVGIGFGIDSLITHDRAKVHCNGDVCDPLGVDLRDHAITSGNISTVAFIAGGALLLSGIILVATAPKGPKQREASSPWLTNVAAGPQIAPGGGGVAIRGAFQ
jgi:hypothetical protein